MEPTVFSYPKDPIMDKFTLTYRGKRKSLALRPTTQTAAMKWLQKQQTTLKVTKGGFFISRTDLPLHAFSTIRPGRLTKAIGFTFFGDHSFLTWQDQGRHLFLLPLTYTLNTTPDQKKNLFIDKDSVFSQKGPKVGTYKPSPLDQDYLFSADAITNPVKRRWAFEACAALTDIAEAALKLSRTAPKPWTTTNAAPRGGAALVPGLSYDFSTPADSIAFWLEQQCIKHAPARSQNTTTAHITSGYLQIDNTYKAPVLNLTSKDIPPQVKRKIMNAFETRVEQGLFGPWWSMFHSCFISSYGQPRQDLLFHTITPARFSAHDILYRLAS